MAISCFPYVYLAGSCPLNHFIPKNGPQAISKKEVGGFQSLRNQLCFGYFVCFKKIDIKKKVSLHHPKETALNLFLEYVELM